MGELAVAGGRVDPHLRDHHYPAQRIVRRAAQSHARVLKPETWPAWLGEQPPSVNDLKAMLGPYPSDEMISWPVSPRVGNVKNNDPTLIEPIGLQ
jgi:putative SOS response-associated peptidase YedK